MNEAYSEILNRNSFSLHAHVNMYELTRKETGAEELQPTDSALFWNIYGEIFELCNNNPIQFRNEFTLPYHEIW
jgi:hypothetical protein